MSQGGHGTGPVRRVALDGPAGRRCAWLRALTGADEEALGGTDTQAAVMLLDQLLVALPGTAVRPGDAADLSVTERDLLLAAVCRAAFGSRIEAVGTCTACASPFDLDFDLDALVAETMAARPPLPADGFYALPDGGRFRLPTGEDELAALGLPLAQAAELLLERCCPATAPADRSALEAAMQAAGPVLDRVLSTLCPECSTPQELRFAIQQYLLDRLAREAPRRLAEIHQIASAYGWGLEEILSLRREQRRVFAALAGGERSPPAAWLAP